MKELDEGRFGDLLSWGKRHGAGINESVEVFYDEATKFSLRVKESTQGPLQAGYAAVTCPASLTLSFANALIGGLLPSDLSTDPHPQPQFPSSFMDSLPPHVIGRFFLIQQYLLERDSLWWPYIQTLPQPEHLASWALPPFWPEDDLDFLEETNARVAVEEIQANLKREFKQARKILKESNFPGWQTYNRVLYNWAFSIFTSRGFRPSTILSGTKRTQISKLLPPNCEIDDFSVLMPIFDIANHSLESKIIWDSTSDPESCQLKNEEAYLPGQQIFNNYGKKTNSELLLGYGFIIDESEKLHNDYIHVRKRQTEAGSTDYSKIATKPTDFLVSLRTLADPSSLVGRSRQRVAASSDVPVLPEFSHVEDLLVWDLAVAQISDNEREALAELVPAPPGAASATTDDYLRRLISSPPDPRLLGVLSKVKGTLLAKLGYDYERLKGAERDEQSEDSLFPENRNQELAMKYRQQCGKVLENAIASLSSGGTIMEGVN
jgi:hypothetical protein